LLEVGTHTFACQAQSSRCVKYNRLHKVKNHRHFTWCYKANIRINLPRLKTKQGKPRLYSFKFLNCKDKLTLIHVSFGSITLIRNGIQRNIKSFKTIEANQFTQLWVVSQHNFKKSLSLFIEHLKEQVFYW